ncbi:pyridoxal phosphate phosphatase-like, partial [Teleopsis dalmanni]|uniref:pyridoxal phosphate phosphatase-like n=1 Tax=Teleopsis dalmanni TaxID=139649 RepID=UPI0018CEB61F
KLKQEERIIPESVNDLREAIYCNDPVKAVIIDVDFNLTAAKLMRAHVHLKNPDCLFIGGAADVLIPFGGMDVIGSGPFISVVEESTKRKATILGKPGLQLCELLKRNYSLQDAKRALFIGDSLTSDIKFGKMCGFQTLLVLTGGTKSADLNKYLSLNETPDFIANTLADLCELKS